MRLGPLGLGLFRRISPGTKAASVAPPSASPFVHAARARLAPHRAACWYLGYAPPMRRLCARRPLGLAVGHECRALRPAGLYGPFPALSTPRPWHGCRRRRPSARPSQMGGVRAALGGEGEAATRRPCASLRRPCATLAHPCAAMRLVALQVSPAPPPSARPARPRPLPPSASRASPPVVHAACASARRSSTGYCNAGSS